MTDYSTPKPEIEQTRTASAPGQLPGRRLREARELQGLKMEDIAERLHLQQAQVEALENDDYARFSAPIFISGYLRNYARLLGLDPEAVVRALERQGLEQPPILSELTAKMPSMRQRRGPSPRTRAALVAGGTLAFLLLLWVVLRPADTGSGEDGAKPPPAPAAAAPEVPPAVEVIAAAKPKTAAAPAQPPALAAQGTPEDEIREEPPPNPDEPMDELVLRFSGESWVEVADVTGRRMAYRMANFPDVLRLRGLAPFDILLGNARNVSIEYNGRPYENVPISRTNVASFRLGESIDEGVKRDASEQSDPPT
jgi:cytoskeleton protein RodZ